MGQNDLSRDHISEHKAYSMTKVISWLDRGGDINVTSFNSRGLTILQMACFEDDAKLVAELCARGADVNLKAGGKTALMHCAVVGSPACGKLLLEYGADPHMRADVDDTDFTQYDGMTAQEMLEQEIAQFGMRPRHRALLVALQQYAGAPPPSVGPR